MAWVATLGSLGIDYGNVNTVQIVRVSPLITTVVTEGLTTNQNTKYYFKVVTGGEVLKSVYFDTLAEATIAQAQAVSDFNV